jgi:Domain of unknown function (DUF4055)
MTILKHPDYDNLLPDWVMISDFYKGQRFVKSKKTSYLPMTPGMIIDDQMPDKLGTAAYDNYIARAVFPDYIKEAVEVSIGLLHQKDAAVELPPELESLRNKCSNKGESVLELLVRINEHQLVPGRCGLLVDMPELSLGEVDPFIALYDAASVYNWDESNDYVNTDKVSFVALDESVNIRKGAGWYFQVKSRVLKIDAGVYQQAVFENDVINEEFGDYITPMYKGVALNEIPFVFVNGKDLLPNPDTPPLLGLANTVLSVYRGEADYRYTLFMQSQETLVIEGQVINPTSEADIDAPLRVGAGSKINVQQGGKAYYIGVNSKGLSEQRLCLEADRKRAELQTGKVIGDKSNVESGEALRVRRGSEVATLNQIALTSARALERCLKMIAKLKGADESLVKVSPNLNFTKVGMQGQELVNLMQSRQLGAPLSLESIHAYLTDKGLTTMEFLSEVDKVLKENKLGLVPDPNTVKSGMGSVSKPNNQQPT